MRHLVPERGLPRERPAGTRVRRIKRHDPAEARTERADHAWKPCRAHSEVVVLRENLDENRALRRELVLRRQGLQRLLREWHRILAQDRSFSGIQLQDDVAFADLDELVERIEQCEQVVGDQVVRIDLEGTIECQTRLSLVAGAHQVHAELCMRP